MTARRRSHGLVEIRVETRPHPTFGEIRVAIPLCECGWDDEHPGRVGSDADLRAAARANYRTHAEMARRRRGLMEARYGTERVVRSAQTWE